MVYLLFSTLILFFLSSGVTEYFEKDEMLVDLAVEQDVFSFLRNSVLGNPGFHSEVNQLCLQ